jgi:MerR family transcriptional regulator, thiopeptide resistance regulator
LQDILFFRELGMPLEEIKRAIDAPDYDRVAALRSRRNELQAQTNRMAQLIQTIDRTIRSLEENQTMSPEEMYTGVSPEKQAEYENYLVNRFGDCAAKQIAESKERTRNWSGRDYHRAREVHDELNREFARHLQSGLTASDPAVQKLVRRHFELISQHWTPNRDAYIGLGQMYLDHPEFSSYYAGFDSKLAGYLADAMRIFAEHELPAAPQGK